jgi:diguanylate cyclase (GGDEF)-like protein
MPQTFYPETDRIMAEMPMSYTRTDLQARVIHINGYFHKKYGIPLDHFMGTAWQDLIHPDDRSRMLLLFAKDFFINTTTVIAVRLVLREDLVIPVLYLADDLVDEAGKRIGFAVLGVDISQGLRDIAHHTVEGVDPLTQLPNRFTFLSKLQEMHLAHKLHPEKSALVLIDLRGLAKINELWGYAIGDQLLMHLAEKLRANYGTKYCVGRYEGDKFGMMVQNFKNVDELEEITQCILDLCNKSVTLPQGNFTLNVTLGVAISAENNGEVELLMRHAREALRNAKKTNQHIEFFDQDMHKAYSRTRRIVACLFNAISQEQFELYYQPQVQADTEKLSGIEVLLRWKHPELGMIEPGEFIPIAEESGFIIHLGKWVMNHALMQYRVWSKKFPDKMKSLKLSINLSPLQLQDVNLIDDFLGFLEENQVAASSVIFELTENAIMQHPETSVAVLNQLKDLGIFLSIDDFGTGYSSLNYLRFLPLNQIKIDRSFIQAVHKSHKDAAVVKGTIELASALGMSVIAEGVEKESELAFLRENGCNLVQGFYFSHPLNAQAMEEYIQQNT